MHKSQICADLVNAVQTVMPGRVPTLTPPGDRGQRQQRRRDDGCDDADTYADEFKLLT